MKITCSWCKKFLGEKEPFEDKAVTHAKCPECIQKQKNEERLANTAAEGKTITLENGIKGFITIGGKDTPLLQLGDVVISGKEFLCVKKDRPKVEKHLAGLVSDEVDYTFLHSSVIEIPKTKRRKKGEPEEKPKEPIQHNCTVRVSKAMALAWFDASTAHFSEVYGQLAEFLVDTYLEEQLKKKRLPDQPSATPTP